MCKRPGIKPGRRCGRSESYCPVPLNAIVCGEPLAVSVMVMVAVRAPVVAGAKCPWIVQLPPAATLLPHVLPKTNDDAFAPVNAMLPIPSVEVPVLVSVTLFEALDEPTVWLPNGRLAADRDAVVGVTPIPPRVKVCGEFVALSARVTEAVSAPVVAGVKWP